MQQPRWTWIVWATVALLGAGGFVPAYSPASAHSRLQTQSEINLSAGKEYRKADAAMQPVYNKLIAVLKPEQRALLKEAQISWLKFRDAEAEFLACKVKGGSIYPMILAAHMTDLTFARTEELKKARKLFATVDGGLHLSRYRRVGERGTRMYRGFKTKKPNI